LAFTETAWAHPVRLHSKPFEFDYDYQRAEMEELLEHVDQPHVDLIVPKSSAVGQD
jgi:uncharacterized protein YecE (DUF72 family)